MLLLRTKDKEEILKAVLERGKKNSSSSKIDVWLLKRKDEKATIQRDPVFEALKENDWQTRNVYTEKTSFKH